MLFFTKRMTDQGSQFTVQTGLSTLNEELQGNVNESADGQEQERPLDFNGASRNTDQYVNEDIAVSNITSTLLNDNIAEGEEVFDDSDNFDEADPLSIRALAEHFDSLISEISTKTNDLATRVSDHVEAKKYNNDMDIETINTRLVEMRQIISNSNQLNTEIDKLDQLRVYTREFKDRIKNIEKTLREREMLKRRQRH